MPSALARVVDGFIHPRSVLLNFTMLMFGTALLEWRENDPYAPGSQVWAVVALVAGVACLLAAFRPGRLTVALAGALFPVAAFGQAFASAHYLIAEKPTLVVPSLLGVGCWLAVAWIGFAIIALVIGPWAAVLRRR